MLVLSSNKRSRDGSMKLGLFTLSGAKESSYAGRKSERTPEKGRIVRVDRVCVYQKRRGSRVYSSTFFSRGEYQGYRGG